jgi:hypothetical protein
MRQVLPALVVILLAAAPARAADPGAFSLGMNLSGVTDYSSELVFVDLFKAARTWVSQADGKGWGQGPPLALRPDGYPAAIAPGCHADSVVVTGMKGCGLGGRYVCLYEGKGAVDVRMDAKVVDRRPGRLVVDVKPDADTVHLRLSATDPADPVRNVRLVPEARETDHADRPFRDDFLARWKGATVLRFMDWQRTNDSPVVNWADRPTPASFSQAGKGGVALEYMLQAADAVGADPWFCMPHLATDDSVRAFAKAVKPHLKPGRKVYVESSNECWNGQFGQARYCQKKGLELKLRQNPYEAQLRYFSKRSVEVFRIWESEIPKGQLVRVLAAQSANPWTGATVLDFEGAARTADVIAIAPYFGNKYGNPKTAAEVRGMMPGALVAALKTDLEASLKSVRAYAAEAKKRGVALVAYEAGQHLAGYGGAENDEALTRLFIAANRHPGMGRLYRDYFRGWRDAGGGLCCVFSSTARPSKWGSWGALEHTGQPPAEAPKFRAVRELLDAQVSR